MENLTMASILAAMIELKPDLGPVFTDAECREALRRAAVVWLQRQRELGLVDA